MTGTQLWKFVMVERGYGTLEKAVSLLLIFVRTQPYWKLSFNQVEPTSFSLRKENETSAYISLNNHGVFCMLRTVSVWAC